MKEWLSYLFSLFLLGIFAVLVVWFLYTGQNKYLVYISPLPDFLTLGKNNQVTNLDIWSPILETFASTSTTPEVQARSALLYDLQNNKVIYEKDARARVPMASLTKIMTAIIALEDQHMPEKYTVRGENLVGEDSMGLEVGEILTKEELL